MSDIDAVLRRAVDAGKVPGIVATAATADRVIYEGAFGRRGTAETAPMDLGTVFRIASMTKAITATAAMSWSRRAACRSTSRPARSSRGSPSRRCWRVSTRPDSPACARRGAR